jgi:hypothetical protein
MAADLDDTVIVTPQPAAPPPPLDTADTVLSVPRPLPAPLEPIPGPQPVVTGGVYAIRVGLAGEALLLDVPCFTGRNPTPPRVVRGDLPRLVRVASTGREVSSTHLEVRQLGASVIVTDLRSTNGSIVMVPGATPRTLRQGESMVVSPGTLVDIGDDTIIQILPMHQPGAASAGRQS